MSTSETVLAPAPRYLRFMTALVLGAALATVPVVAGCGDDDPPGPDAGVMVDAVDVVDGPLQPPDLRRLA